jgi:hypothetical protein
VTVEADLAEAIVACLATHAECRARFGTEKPEGHAMLGSELIARMRRQRAKVDESLEGSPEVHLAHVRALTKGMQVCIAKLAEIDG